MGGKYVHRRTGWRGGGGGYGVLGSFGGGSGWISVFGDRTDAVHLCQQEIVVK